jgi:hypothetical protein
MKKPIFPWVAGAGAAWVVVLLLALPVRSSAATPDQSKLHNLARYSSWMRLFNAADAYFEKHLERSSH